MEVVSTYIKCRQTFWVQGDGASIARTIITTTGSFAHWVTSSITNAFKTLIGHHFLIIYYKIMFEIWKLCGQILFWCGFCLLFFCSGYILVGRCLFEIYRVLFVLALMEMVTGEMPLNENVRDFELVLKIISSHLIGRAKSLNLKRKINN